MSTRKVTRKKPKQFKLFKKGFGNQELILPRAVPALLLEELPVVLSLAFGELAQRKTCCFNVNIPLRGKMLTLRELPGH